MQISPVLPCVALRLNEDLNIVKYMVLKRMINSNIFPSKPVCIANIFFLVYVSLRSKFQQYMLPFTIIML